MNYQIQMKVYHTTLFNQSSTSPSRCWTCPGHDLTGISLGRDVQPRSGLRCRVGQREDRLRDAGHHLRQERGGLRAQGREEDQGQRLRGQEVRQTGVKVSAKHWGSSWCTEVERTKYY